MNCADLIRLEPIRLRMQLVTEGRPRKIVCVCVCVCVGGCVCVFVCVCSIGYGWLNKCGGCVRTVSCIIVYGWLNKCVGNKSQNQMCLVVDIGCGCVCACGCRFLIFIGCILRWMRWSCRPTACGCGSKFQSCRRYLKCDRGSKSLGRRRCGPDVT